MSKFKHVLGSVLSILGLGAPKMPPAPVIPAPAIPAPPAPATRLDTGAGVVIGTSADIKNQRVSGRRASSSNSQRGNILGGLGRSGLSI